MLPEPEFVEAMALHQAASLAREKGLGQVIFASDCLSLVQLYTLRLGTDPQLAFWWRKSSLW
jgi:hypothetical protein